MSIVFDRAALRTAFGILATLGLVFSMFALTAPVLADGDDTSAACQTDVNVDAEDAGQSGDEVTYTAGEGEIVTAICIKSGNGAFGDLKHSGLIEADGTYGDGCYTVEGIGTATVTVTRSDTDGCKEISHVDVVTGPGESASESPSESASESPSESASESPSESASESPSESASESPEDKITICHAAGREGTDKYIELELPYNAVYGPGGHFNEGGTPQAGHEDDILGECPDDESPSESPSESASESPSESASESPSESASESPSESESESPSESASESPRESELGGNPTPKPGGGTVPDTALGSEGIPAWPFALLTLMSLGGLFYLRLSTETERTR